MIVATHPYGAVRRCKVEAVIPDGRWQVIIATDEFGEGHILIYRKDFVVADPGDRGTLTFTARGGAAGYWLFSREVPADGNG